MMRRLPVIPVAFFVCLLLLCSGPALAVDIVPPAAVENVKSIRQGDDILLTWGPVSISLGGSPETVAHYRVYRGSVPSFFPDRTGGTNVIAAPLTTSYLDAGAGADPGAYYYLVSAVDENGNESITRLSEIQPVPTGQFRAFGVQTYVRGTSDPITIVDNFSVLDPTTSFTLVVHNRGMEDDEFELVSSSVIAVNGVQVLGPEEFNQNVTLVETPVTLDFTNEISVELRAKPGGTILLEIVGVDEDPPLINASVSPTANIAGWHNSDVTVTFDCSDATSGIKSCPAPVMVQIEGGGQVVSGTAVDQAGNTTSVSVTINLDKTPPSINENVTPPANTAGWHRTDVTVSFACADAHSGIASCTDPVTVTEEGSDLEVMGTAVDLAGNVTLRPVPLKIDRTPPVLNVSSPQEGEILTQLDITAAGTATDGLSGIDRVEVEGSQAAFSNPGWSAPLVLSEFQNGIDVMAFDLAGNETSQRVNFTISSGSCRALFFTKQIVLADDCFRAVIDADPSTSAPETLEAHFFRSLTRLARIVGEQADGPDPNTFTDSLKEMLDQFGFSPIGRSVFDFTSEPPVVLPADSPTGGEVQEFVKNVLLSEVQAALEDNLVHLDGSFQLDVTGEELLAFGIPDTPSLEVDFGDVAILRAGLYSLDGLLRMFLGNDLDLDILDINALVLLNPARFQQDILDPHPELLRLVPGGDALLMAAGASFRQGIDSYFEASDFIRNSEALDDQSDDLFTIEPADLFEELELRESLGTIRCMLDGAALTGVDDTGAICDVTKPSVLGAEVVDISRFFDAPVDLRDLMPPFSFDPVCKNDYVDVAMLTPTNPFPDPTLNGIFPNLTQARLVEMLDLHPEIVIFGSSLVIAPSGSARQGHLQIEADNGRFVETPTVIDIRFEKGTEFGIFTVHPSDVTLPATLCSGIGIAYQFTPPTEGGFIDTFVVETDDPNLPLFRHTIRGCTGGFEFDPTRAQIVLDCDNDGVLDPDDNCPDVPNGLQEDADINGVGDACEPGPVASFLADGNPEDPENQCPGSIDRLSLQAAGSAGAVASVDVVLTDCDSSLAVNSLFLELRYDRSLVDFLGCEAGSMFPAADLVGGSPICNAFQGNIEGFIGVNFPLVVSTGAAGQGDILRLHFRVLSPGIESVLRFERGDEATGTALTGFDSMMIGQVLPLGESGYKGGRLISN